MKKIAIFIMTSMILIGIVGCSSKVSNNTMDKSKQNIANKQNPDVGQNLQDGEPNINTATVTTPNIDLIQYNNNNNTNNYNKNNFRNNKYDGFALYTPFGPVNPDEAPPALNMPINWYQDHNIVTDFPTL